MKGQGLINIHQDGHPINMTNVAFPPDPWERVQLGVALGFGMTLGGGFGLGLLVALGSILKRVFS